MDSIRELKENIGDDDYMDWVHNNNGNNDNDNTLNCSQMSNSQDFDDSQDPHGHNMVAETDHNDNDAALTASQEQILPTITRHLLNDFADTYPGEKMFTRFQGTVDLSSHFRDLYSFALSLSQDVSCELESLIEFENVQLQRMTLECVDSCITNCHQEKKNCLPVRICESVWRVLTCSQDCQLTRHSFKLLTNHLLREDVEWVPRVNDAVELLCMCGADMDVVVPRGIRDALSMGVTEQTNNNNEVCPSLSPKTIRKCFTSRLSNLSYGLQLLTTAVRKHKTKYSTEDTHSLLILTCRLSVEKVVQTELCVLKSLIGSLLEVYESTSWTDEISRVWTTLSLFGMHHRNLLKLVETVPPSNPRGAQFRQFLAFNCASSVLLKSTAPPAPRQFPIRIVDVFNLLMNIDIDEDTVYFELYSVFRLLFFCINTDHVKNSQRPNLTKLEDKLRMIRYKIKECQGAYLDRTKVKDCIMRIITKLNRVAKGSNSQSTMDRWTVGSQTSNSDESQSQ